MENRSSKSCKQQYESKKAKYAPQIDEFDDSDLEEVNEEIKEHLHDMLDSIDSMRVNSDTVSKLTTLLSKLKESLSEEKAIQALVFFFNRDNGKLFLSAFGPVQPDSLSDTELSLSNRQDMLVSDMGPIKMSDYESTYDEIMSVDEIEECSIDLENDDLMTLAIVKAYSIFEEAFLKLDFESVLANTSVKYPLYCYIQESGGGYSNLLTTINSPN